MSGPVYTLDVMVCLFFSFSLALVILSILMTNLQIKAVNFGLYVYM